jgi:hypothetical protein
MQTERFGLNLADGRRLDVTIVATEDHPVRILVLRHRCLREHIGVLTRLVRRIPPEA